MNIFCDILGLGGFAPLAVGLWWVWPPLALIVCGALALAAGIYRARTLKA